MSWHWLLHEPWPWWLGAIALAVVAVGFTGVLRRPFGVSGIFAKMLDPIRELQRDRTRAALADSARLRAALEAATAKHFGDAAARAEEPPAEPSGSRRVYDRYPAHVVMIVSIGVGGFLGALASGTVGQSSYGGDFARLFGSGAGSLALLVLGGALVGFGTQMGGGCTSGHGLTGCGRAQPGSMAATAIFFGTGIVVSLLLEWGLG